jgi:hypothetical protein
MYTLHGSLVENKKQRYNFTVKIKYLKKIIAKKRKKKLEQSNLEKKTVHFTMPYLQFCH